MPNQYPTETEITKIKNWDAASSTKEFMDYVKSCWWMPDWGWHRHRNVYHVSTGGWSGNEDLIQAMRTNVLFWSRCWISTTRGGHYVFKLHKTTIVKTVVKK